MGKKQIRELENTLDGVQGGFSLYRQGINEYFIPYGFVRAHEKLEAAKKDLVALGLYEQCYEALVRAEALAKLGPEHDRAAEMLILNVNRALTHASGTNKAMSRIMREKPNATYDDFKPPPDGWAMEDLLEAQRRGQK